MKELKIWIALHLILGPWAVLTMMDDAKHPERWVDWWCNPTYAVPFCLTVEAVVLCVLIRGWLQERQRAKVIRLMGEANRLRGEGRYQEADVIWQEVLRLDR